MDKKPERKPEGWTAEELAAASGKTASRIRQLLRKPTGGIKGRKHGRDWVIPNTEAQRFLEQERDK